MAELRNIPPTDRITIRGKKKILEGHIKKKKKKHQNPNNLWGFQNFWPTYDSPVSVWPLWPEGKGGTSVTDSQWVRLRPRRLGEKVITVSIHIPVNTFFQGSNVLVDI